jgi:hypothetical protein
MSVESANRWKKKNVRLGLRTDGRPRAKKKPCGCLAGSCLKCRATKKSYLRGELVKKMHADYMAGMSQGALGRKYRSASGKPRSGSEFRQFFSRRGLFVKPTPSQCRHQLGNPGCFAAVTPKTETEIAALVGKLARAKLPAELRQEWRSWPFEKRAAFIARLRRKFPSTRPTTPFSANVEPFDYSSPRAWEIANQMNAGLPSNQWPVHLKIKSEGVIYQGRLYFWLKHHRGDFGAYYIGPYSSSAGRPALHQIIWTQLRGKIPPKNTVVFADGNKNNFDPKNLVLKTRNQNLRENHFDGHQRRAARGASLLLSQFNRGEKNVAAQLRMKK